MKVLVFTAIAALFVFVSCTNDDIEEQTENLSNLEIQSTLDLTKKINDSIPGDPLNPKPRR